MSDKIALAGSERRALAGAIATGRTAADEQLSVTLKLRRKAPLTVEAAAAARVIGAALAQAYGADPADIAAVTTALEALGLRVQSTNAATRTVIVQGSVAAMEAAFDVKLFDYKHPDGDYRGRVGAVCLPPQLAGIVVGVFGLDNRRVARRRRPPTRDAAAGPGVDPVPASHFAARYNYPPGDGGGQTVGLLEFGGGYFPADLAQFCTAADIVTPPTVVPISVDGTATNAEDGAEGEVMLDIEVVASVCPASKIAVYFGAWTEAGWIAALDGALQDQTNDPGVLSISWGNAEDTDIWSKAAMDQINETLTDAVALRVTVCAAAGDDGSSDAITDGHAHADFPSSSPMALAVGGTTARAGAPDIVWKEGDGLRSDQGGSTGGGVSAVFPRPAWQSATPITSVNPGAIAGRSVPDIAANADWNASPYLLVVDGGTQPNGGTSAASPLVASLVALINAALVGAGKPRVGYLTPLLYQASAGGAVLGTVGCTDVVSGNNDTAAAALAW
jgi:kumamolisin